ncbi:MAG TPA: NIPSNAP family protein [Opitutaceae bacterium]|nr:NIPSNAP family protein [Opitutaceae bacterium]
MFSLKCLLRFLSAFSLTAFLVASFVPLASAAEDSRVYELRTYTTLPGRYDALLTRFRDHTVKLFEKHGMTNVGYWQPMDTADGAGQKLIYLLSYPSREAATASWKAFGADPEWQKVKKASEEDGKIVAKVESVFLKTTDFSPALTGAYSGGSRVFELRTYVGTWSSLCIGYTVSRPHLGVFQTLRHDQPHLLSPR